jgi:hypothetical protein
MSLEMRVSLKIVHLEVPLMSSEMGVRPMKVEFL